MVGIAAVSITNTTAQALSATKVASGEKEKADDGSSPLQVDASKLRGNAQAQGAQGGGESSEPSHIQQLRQMIERLRKVLAEQQKQLASLMAQKMNETEKMALVTAKQASISTLTGQIAQATAQLIEALQKTGGNSAGSMLSTQA